MQPEQQHRHPDENRQIDARSTNASRTGGRSRLYQLQYIWLSHRRAFTEPACDSDTIAQQNCLLKETICQNILTSLGCRTCVALVFHLAQALSSHNRRFCAGSFRSPFFNLPQLSFFVRPALSLFALFKHISPLSPFRSTNAGLCIPQVHAY